MDLRTNFVMPPSLPSRQSTTVHDLSTAAAWTVLSDLSSAFTANVDRRNSASSLVRSRSATPIDYASTTTSSTSPSLFPLLHAVLHVANHHCSNDFYLREGGCKSVKGITKTVVAELSWNFQKWQSIRRKKTIIHTVHVHCFDTVGWASGRTSGL